MQNRQTYIIIIALVSLSLSAIVAAVNWFVDPYGLFKSPTELALVKPEIYNYERELKVHSVTQQRANGLVLGASTSSVGLDPAHPGWKADRVYNMAVGQASISTGNIQSLAASNRWPALGRILAGTNRTRGYGDYYHYHRLAAGQLDAVIESDVNILDIAALYVIVTEAGGVWTDLEGCSPRLDTRSVLAATPTLHALLSDEFNRD
jgi:hypothetical protein